jgi:phospholipase C
MGYWAHADQPFYNSLASVFPIADRYFCSVLGPTYPNRRYLISATSIGQVNDTLQSAYDGFRRYGFRVPCAVVSPWARPDYVSHRVFDHTSICALVEANWNLPAMTYRDANARNLLDLLDLRRPAFLRAPPLLGTDPAALACSTTGPGTIPPPGSISPPP